MLVPITIPATRNTRHLHGMIHVNRSHFGSRLMLVHKTNKQPQSNVFETKASVLLVNLVKTFLHTRKKEVFFLNTLKISLVQPHQEQPYQAMFVETQQQKKQNKLSTRKRKSQDATKITCAPAVLCIQYPWPMRPISMTAQTCRVKNISNRTTIKNSTEETDDVEFVRQYNSSHMLMRMLYLQPQCIGTDIDRRVCFTI